MLWGAYGYFPDWPEAQVVVSLCVEDGPIQPGHGVYTNHGVVNDGAFADCDPGDSGTGYSISWSHAHGPLLLEGSNAFSGYACDVWYQCGGGGGELVYSPPKDSGVTIVPNAGMRSIAGKWDTLTFTMTDGTAAGPFAYDSITFDCELQCERIGTTVTVPDGGSTTFSVRVRSVNTGTFGFSVRYCRAIGFGPEIWACTFPYVDAVAVLPPPPVARVVAVYPVGSSFYRQSGSGATSIPFRVKNIGTDSTTIQLSSLCPSSVTAAGCTHSTSVKLNSGDSSTINLAFSPTSPGASVHGVLALTGSAMGEIVTGQAGLEVGPTDGSTVTVTLDLAGLNPEGSIAREQCLSVAAGDAAGVECASLRLVHPIQGLRTMGAQRDLSLSYVSSHANAMPFIAANVTVVNGTPDSVRAVLQLAGFASLTRTLPWPNNCRGVACRIVFPVPVDSLNLSTGWKSYSLQVNALSGGTSLGTATGSGGLAIVNRANSPFGAGWWLQGLEELVAVHDTLRLWVGGDGSTRLYRRTASDTNTFLAVTAVSRPDSLQRSGSEWIRRLPNGAQTRFNSSGQHTSTLNALVDTTTFVWASGTLDEIRLPRPSTTLQPRVKFVYSGSGSSRRLDSVHVRPGASSDSSGQRTTVVHRSLTWRVDSIRDPDGRRVRFTTDSVSRRVSARRNRLSDTTTFAYDAFGAVSTVTVRVPGDSSVVTRFCPAETRSLIACGWTAGTVGGVILPLATTRLDGPRGGTFDVTTFYVNKWGGPDTVIAPDGGITRLQRDATFPALVTQSVNPVGFTQRSWYNARGLPDSVKAINPVGLNQDARTRYRWNAVWQLPDTVVPPLGAPMHYRNNASQPVVDSQWVVGHDSTKVRFTYDSRYRISQVKTPLGGFERVHYDALLGNVKAQRAGTDTTTILRDRYGRDSVIFGTDNTTRNDVFLDAMSRVDSTRTVATGLASTALPRSGITVSSPTLVLVVSNTYDAEGNVLSVSRRDTVNQYANADVTTTFTYDAARRVKTRTENSRTESFAYNAAGQQTRHTTARGYVIEQGFDAVGRLQYRFVPGIVSTQTGCGPCVWNPIYPAVNFPYFPTVFGTSSSPNFVIRGRVTQWSYDRAGRDLSAGTYYLNGTLASQDGFTIARDLLGRDSLRQTASSKQWFTYHSSLGHLTQVRAWTNQGSDTATMIFAYDAAGREKSRNVAGLSFPLGESRNYDSNGRTVRRQAFNASWTPLFDDSLQYNNRGLLTLRLSASSDAALADSAAMYYNGMGALVAVDRVRLYGSQNVSSDEFTVDALGNRLGSHANRGRVNGNVKQTSSYSGDNQTGTAEDKQLGVNNNSVPVVQQYDEVSFSRDESGNEVTRLRERYYWDSLMPPTYRQLMYGTEFTRHWYDAENRLRATQTTENKQYNKGRTTFTTYEYDRFGRRTEIRVRRDTATCVDDDDTTLPQCLGSVHTFSWFGDQIVSESRLSLQLNAPNDHYGTVSYIHGGGIDQPLFVVTGGEFIVPHSSGRGGYEAGTYLDGTAVPGSQYHWPARTQGIFLGNDIRLDAEEPTGWLGSLMDGKTDPSGLQYMRNRYYDPSTGRFTQPDPIGLAGGLNAFGYAGGDPVNKSDPFGLCPKHAGGDGKTDTAADCSRAVLDAWNGRNVTLEPGTTWDNVDATLRDAVTKASIELNAVLHVYSTTGGTHAPESNHGSGLAVDISRVNGVSLSSMSRGAAAQWAGRIAGRIWDNIPASRRRELIGPHFAARAHRDAWSARDASTLMGQHNDHVHGSILPPEE